MSDFLAKYLAQPAPSPEMSFTDYAAWWGALVATLVLFWDIYKWRMAGPCVSMTARAGMRISSGLDFDAELEGKPIVSFETANNGSQPTTLIKLVMVHYNGFWAYVRRKPKYMHVKNPGIGLESAFPYKLDVGETWTGRADQNDDLDAMLSNGRLYANLYCSHRKRPVAVRIRQPK